MMPTPDGHEIFWEAVGDPAGKPAVVLHGRPGSGCAPWWAEHLDLARYRVVMFASAAAAAAARTRSSTTRRST